MVGKQNFTIYRETEYLRPHEAGWFKRRFRHLKLLSLAPVSNTPMKNIDILHRLNGNNT
jgi:hypothetical protein